MAPRCAVARGYDDGVACGRVATVRVTVGCRHEHLTRDVVCAECAAGLLARQMVCVACDELPDGAHVCASTLVATAAVVESAGDAVVVTAAAPAAG